MTIRPPVASRAYDPENEAQFRRMVMQALQVDATAPRLESCSIVLNEEDGKLHATATAGKGTRSVRFEIDNDPNFSSPLINSTVDLGEGESTTVSSTALATSQRDIIWYLRCTPHAGTTGNGIAGTHMITSTWANLGDAPIVAARASLATNQDTADVYCTVTSPLAENVRLHVQLSDGATAYSAVTGNGVTTPLFSLSGTEFGPSTWFYNGTVWGQILNDIALTRDQVKRIFLQGEAEDSGNKSSWIPLALDLNGMPWLESVSLTWDESADQLKCVVKGGARCASVKIEFDDDPTFASVNSTSYSNLTDGSQATATYGLSASQRDKPWYVRATPYNGSLSGGVPTGLAGQAQEATTRVEGNHSLTWEIPATDFRAAKNTYTWDYAGSAGELNPGTANVQAIFVSGAGLPSGLSGVTITGIDVQVKRTAAGDVADFALYEGPDSVGAIALRASGTGASTGYFTMSVSGLSLSTSGKRYTIYVQLKGVAVNTDAGFLYATIYYTREDPRDAG